MKKYLRFFLFPFSNTYGFACFLNIFLCCLALCVKQLSFEQVGRVWVESFWSFSAFTLHIVMTFVSGYALIVSPYSSYVMRMVQGIPSTGLMPALVLIVAVVSFVNWGMGLLSSAMLCRAVMRSKRKVCYPALVASAYSGFLVWHGGITGSAPLLVASQKVLAPDIAGPIPLSETVFAHWHLSMLFAVVFVMMCAAYCLRFFPKRKAFVPQILDEPQIKIEPVSREESFFVWTLGLGGLFFCAWSFMNGHPFDLSLANIIFFLLALLSHGGWSAFAKAIKEGVANAHPIIIQFPLYATVAGFLQKTSMGEDMALWFVQGCSSDMLPLVTFLSAGLINILIPSGGGQWMVQGSVVLQAAKQLGVPYAQVVLALAWGDAWTNLIQPFWMLPVMQLCRMKVKDIMPYAIYFLAVSGAVLMVFFFWFALQQV